MESGVEVESVKMEPLQKLVIHFEEHSAEAVDHFRDLVEEVADWGSEPQTWEVEI